MCLLEGSCLRDTNSFFFLWRFFSLGRHNRTPDNLLFFHKKVDNHLITYLYVRNMVCLQHHPDILLHFPRIPILQLPITPHASIFIHDHSYPHPYPSQALPSHVGIFLIASQSSSQAFLTSVYSLQWSRVITSMALVYAFRAPFSPIYIGATTTLWPVKGFDSAKNWYQLNILLYCKCTST